MVAVSCSGKFHAFHLAEQLERHGLLDSFFTSYAYRRDRFLRRFAGRVDKENIPAGKTFTAPSLAILMRLAPRPYLWNNLFDRWVASRMGRRDHRVFIGWSGMSLRTLRAAKRAGRIAILERGSSHIRYQDDILREEYSRFGRKFRIDPRVVEQEEIEYAEADRIAVPSRYAHRTFLERGVPESKLFLNPYGAGAAFRRPAEPRPPGVFRILYLGSVTPPKGLTYLCEAVRRLAIPEDRFEFWIVGGIAEEMRGPLQKEARPNWKIFGHVDHYDLPGRIAACDVAVQPSVDDGFGMVISQTLSCGVPTIATTNTGGPDVIEEGRTGFIVPIRDAAAIADKIQLLFDDPERRQAMSLAAAAGSREGLSWNGYGDRYAAFIRSLAAGAGC